MKSLDFALLLSKYLTQYLPAQRNLSSNTICSYRDTFKLLLIFCRDIQGFNIAKLPMTQLDRKCIEDFILWLRNIRKSSPSTCNQRLCAIHLPPCLEGGDYADVAKNNLMARTAAHRAAACR